MSFEKSNIEEVCKDLEEYVLLQEKHIGTDKFYDYDYKFHKTFIEYSQNGRLKKIFDEYNVLHEMLVRNYYEAETFQIQEDGIDIHKKIMDAFRAKDYQLAMTLTEKHYKAAEQIFKKVLQPPKEKLEEDGSCN
nr:FCD domain-containing protein [Clostridium pascui]